MASDQTISPGLGSSLFSPFPQLQNCPLFLTQAGKCCCFFTVTTNILLQCIPSAPGAEFFPYDSYLMTHTWPASKAVASSFRKQSYFFKDCLSPPPAAAIFDLIVKLPQH